MCVDYQDLNKASPIDDFPLPHIDVLVDNITRHALFSFMDGFSGYNQIRMVPKDRAKTFFITPWGTFCYNANWFKEHCGNISKSHDNLVPQHDA